MVVWLIWLRLWVDWVVCAASDQYAGPAVGQVVDTVDRFLAGGEGWVGSRWPETAKWPVCDPQHIPSHGLLLRALAFYWAGTDTDWHACTMLLRLITDSEGQTDLGDNLQAAVNSLTVWQAKHFFYSNRLTRHDTEWGWILWEEINGNVSIDTIWKVEIVYKSINHTIYSPQKSTARLCCLYEWHHPLQEVLWLTTTFKMNFYLVGGWLLHRTVYY